ncbi:hypothetical protein DICPUDRAFT_148685 [Dictyostelium purpureum]|uniref:Prokaryotic glutathione synthetase ATP-binding domain-containing protein n=1 Tax=Dictyostelium purpureum TaxID=5786 RepID=F0ZBR0_DICPU|nr:uncharacterized protein DICPUDRAFT_148685 [Dictyostelium purpureum]EGC38641.1 hypothetical protein DICPUDRAFT_148685 [Dictyostelium purpureum]|eukprot:XP_003284834.1 hypothetical protein DICPUDRAFT_148685 [Dictyostelium purpureum]
MKNEWKRENFDILIIRSLWDYVDKIEKFLKWIEIIQNNNIKVLNDLKAIKWNIDKNYLNELSLENKINVVPSVFIRKNETSPIRAITKAIRDAKYSGLFRMDQNNFVYKPTIGANGLGANRFNLNDILINSEQQEINNEILCSLLSRSDIIVQPFISSIRDEGETSFVFFNGKFSHSIIKKPIISDFRVQECYGGTVEKNLNPSQSEIEVAQNIIDKIIEKNGKILYARIDMLRINGNLHLSESEIFEPTLYFMGDRTIANRFISSVFEILNS